MHRLTSLFCATALVASGSALASDTFNVVTTVKPLNLIVSELTQGVATSEFVIPSGSSPHDYALRPSDVRKLKQADLVVWVGPELESFLVKTMASKPENIALSQQHEINFRYYAEDEQEHAGHETEIEADHAHEGHDHASEHEGHHHNHNGIDPHLWLGPDQAVQAANVITKALIKYDPLHKNTYTANLSIFTTEVQLAVTQLNKQLKPLSDKGYYVFHDGYGYFEQQFKLDNLGHFTVEPDRRPGAKTLLSIREALKNNQAYCVFSEPQFSPAVVKSVTKGTNVKIGTLDPMATDIVEGKGGYVRFLNELGERFSKCLN
ncbi:zinc ABC transporter substrate-binding protein ZnuA [Photobacterium carnosum]|uniref:zinc ABC transporter substrate-binding protein ZnuA n=1 Tax=Photobacterium carnosum TaxID=2023717 RepID=UPI001E61086E|nr:zinc ABC transporter substrate-binding protein ZnuA [Photobacterium carnosum]MCD9513774.1 zinc ABC transporter substrate-binding protein ZnuA [Photobacterium carnosum]